MTHTTVTTDAWNLEIPEGVTGDSPLVVVPTVHPRGDRRVLNCAQSALRAGYRVHFIWLGEGDPSTSAVVGETLLPKAESTKHRLALVGQATEIALSLDADLWHIHDFYLLRNARKWSRKTHRPFVYDVHEYYGEYYASRLPIPSRFRGVVAQVIDRYQAGAVKGDGGANVVARKMVKTFAGRGVPVSVSPNYPTAAWFAEVERVPFADRKHDVVHVGTLTRPYGTEFLVNLIRRSDERGLPFEFTVVERFPDVTHRDDFYEILGDAPKNLTLAPALKAREVPQLLARQGFALSVIADTGQNDIAIPAKCFENTLAGVVTVATDRAGQVAYLREHAVWVAADEGSLDATLDGMLAEAERSEVEKELDEKRESAALRSTWEAVCDKNIAALYAKVRS